MNANGNKLLKDYFPAFNKFQLAGGSYDDIDDYSPVVSDIEEDQNDANDANDSAERSKQGAGFDILQQIFNDQSATKCDLEEENLMDPDEPEEDGMIWLFHSSCLMCEKL